MLFAEGALAQIPKILTLQDRNPHSPTYGCFDRNYWHYKIIDFPSGMSQEMVWPLALAFEMNIPGNPYYQKPAIREWVFAGIRYAAHSSHHDGSCDDYYLFEKAGGAAAFSLLACLESYSLMRLNDPAMTRFFQKRADWLSHHRESGKLANHQALSLLSLTLASRLLETDRWDDAIRERWDLLYSWESKEGWFQEYNGFDPGYHTLTLSCLTRLYELGPNDRLRDSISRGVALISHFVHPDGSFGGEYASRNTYNFFPHGFELAGKWMPDALLINDRFLEGLAKGLGACYADDHIIGHHTWNYLLAWKDFVEERPSPKPVTNERLLLSEAGVLIDQRDNTRIYIALNKGGVFSLYRNGHLVLSDTQFSLVVGNGDRVKNAVGHLIGDYAFQIDSDTIIVQGNLGYAKQKQMKTSSLVLLRLMMVTAGRFFHNTVRKILQKILITGREAAPFMFYRQFQWREGKWHLTDELRTENWKPVIAAGIGGGQTSIFVAMSRTYQQSQLQPWLDLTARVRELETGDSLKLERTL